MEICSISKRSETWRNIWMWKTVQVSGNFWPFSRCLIIQIRSIWKNPTKERIYGQIFIGLKTCVKNNKTPVETEKDLRMLKVTTETWVKVSRRSALPSLAGSSWQTARLLTMTGFLVDVASQLSKFTIRRDAYLDPWSLILTFLVNWTFRCTLVFVRLTEFSRPAVTWAVSTCQVVYLKILCYPLAERNLRRLELSFCIAVVVDQSRKCLKNWFHDNLP